MTTQPSSSSSSSPSIIFDGYTASQSTQRPRVQRLGKTLQTLQDFFKHGFQQFLIAATGGSDPVVRQRCDRHGQIYYTIYDPVSQRRTVCASKTDVRAWLEQRYYRD
ncbi:MAG: hypothetical protein AAGD25_07530 [Cyanobacteria bacterium P01_F01_bin.150]